VRSQFEITGTDKTCAHCKSRPVKADSNKGTLCEVCRSADKNNNHTRNHKTIIVHVDTEGDGKGNILCASIGREDSTSDTLFTRDGAEILLWWLDNLTGLWDGKKQVKAAFFFNYDAAVLSRWTDSKLDSMELIHKAKAHNTNLLCRAKLQDHNDKKCKCEGNKTWYKDTKAIQKIITDGGEGDLIAYDPETHLAIAATPRRRFYVEHRPNGDRYEGYRSLDIHDHGTAFVGGLEKVISDWRPELDDNQRAAIKWGKQARKDNLFNEDPAMVAAYSEAECVAAARCSRLLLNTIGIATGIVIHPSKLFGSGSLADAAFNHHKVPTRTETQVSKAYDWLPYMTYFGGLIESPVVGVVYGRVDEEDICSAFPSTMIHLPCMRKNHGHWEDTSNSNYTTIDDFTRQGINNYTVGHAYVSWEISPELAGSTPPFMVRCVNESVYQPLKGKNIWVTIPELLAGIKRFNKKVAIKQVKNADINPENIIVDSSGYFHHAIKVSRFVYWVKDCDCPPPLAFLQELYNKRLKIKEQMKTVEFGSDEWLELNCHQNAIKLVMNSCYGKLAQRRPEPGKYTNMHIASNITGNARARVRERTWYQEDVGGTVVYQHTDSVLSTNGKPNHQGDLLGQWGLETNPEKITTDACILQPGLMRGLTGGKTASRGVGKDEFVIALAEWVRTIDLTKHPMTWPSITVPTKRMISRRMAIHRRAPELAGHFIPDSMDITVQDSAKRQLDRAYRPSPETQPSMWVVPPIVEVKRAMTLEDVKLWQKNLASLEQNGLLDDKDEIIERSDEFE
jgi:hypothetical protein